MTRACLILAATLWLAVPIACEAEAGCCARCGATCPTQLVCHTICTSRLEEYVCWGEKCETVCMPPKSNSASWAGCTDDLPCDACADCGQELPLLAGWSALFNHPRQCHFRDRSKLMRRTLVESVPTLECVVEELCAGCHATVTPAAAGSPLPTPIAPTAAAGMAPVRLQISDQLPEKSGPLPPVVTASADLLDEPTLAPVVPAIHSVTR